jgi:alkaline phosphatase
MAKNTIIMIGDGMGWEMVRATAIYKQIQSGATGDTLSQFYTEGKGSGLSLQNLENYGLVTTYGTTIADEDGIYDTGNSALEGSLSDRVTGEGEIRDGFEFDPSFNPGINKDGGANAATVNGNLVGYDPVRGGEVPWDEAYYGGEADEGFDKEYIKLSYPDSANTATTLYTGSKTYNGAVGVDIFEQPLESLFTKAAIQGKATGLISSVPIDHATPGAAAAQVNTRSKLDEFGVIDTILQQELGVFKPTVLLGGGHPLSNVDDPLPEGVEPPNGSLEPTDFRYVSEGTYNELRENPTDNIYGYTFLERGVDAAQVLADTAAGIDPETGRLLGIYGARGQEGNLPTASADGDYGTTGFAQFSLGYNVPASENSPALPLGVGDTTRPLLPGETDEQFIARERNENPTLDQLTKASLDVLEDDEDGFVMLVEGGDIDWAAHDNNLDNLIGNTLEFDKSVQTVLDWIENNGGFEENQLVITADHDHYLTLNENFPELLRDVGPNALTYGENSQDTDDALDGEASPTDYDASTPDAAGHFWGSESDVKHDWTNHTNRPVPVYYDGPESQAITDSEGEGFELYGEEIPGIDGLVDQVHIAQAISAQLELGNEFGEEIVNVEFDNDSIELINLRGFGDVTVQASYEISREADFDNEVYFYKVDSANGLIGRELPSGDNYLQAALNNIISPEFSIGDDESESGVVNLEAGSIIGAMIIANGSLEQLQDADTSNDPMVYFSFPGAAGGDGFDHIKLVGNNKFGFEDLPNGGDMDFNDIEIEFTNFAVA